MRLDIRRFVVAHLVQILAVAGLAAGGLAVYDEGRLDLAKGLLVTAGVVAGLTPAVGVLALVALCVYGIVLEVENIDGGFRGARMKFLAQWLLLPIVGALAISTPMLIAYIRDCVPVAGPVVARGLRAVKKSAAKHEKAANKALGKAGKSAKKAAKRVSLLF